MQQAIQIQTVINEAMVKDIPDLQPLLSHRVQMIVLDLEPTEVAQEGKEIIDPLPSDKPSSSDH